MPQPAAVTPEFRDLELGRVCTTFCELATQVFDTPQAIIKLYEGNQLALKGTAGFTSHAQLDDISFCQRKLVPGEPLLIADATHDARYFLEAAVLSGPRLRFYADMPLVCDGAVLGVMILTERQPRHDFTPHKLAQFRQFADTAATLIAMAQGARMRSEMLADLKSQRNRFDRVQDLTGVGFWTIDLKSREVAWSKGLYAIYGLSPKSYKPRAANQLDIYNPSDQSLIIERFQNAVNTGEDFDFTVTIQRVSDKALRTLRTRGGVECDDGGNALRLCGVVLDVTTGAPVQEDLSRDWIEADDGGYDFLTHVADELKTPLGTILAYAHRLNERRPGNPDIATYTTHLLNSAKALQCLVNDTAGTRPDVATPVHQPAASPAEDMVDVVALVKEVVDQFAAQARASQTRLTAHFVDFDNPCACLDAMRLRQVVQNLVNNACKFTRGGLINVTATQVTIENNPWLRISVRDTGIGMDEAQSQALFARPGSSGLGLSISKAIVDMLGGQIGVLSRKGEGSNFWFEIPVHWIETRVLAKDTARSIASRPLRAPIDPMRPVAISLPPRAAPVDEDRINREYLKALLADMKLGMH